jgi:hypothetical protein
MKKEEIYCPFCARVVLYHDVHSTINMNYRCGCGRYFEYNPRKKQLKLINKPERLTSSGARFY